MPNSTCSSMASMKLSGNFVSSKPYSDFEFAKLSPGSYGTPCRVFANFASLKIKPDQLIFMYNIDISIPDRVEDASDAGRPQRNKFKHQKRMIDDSTYKIFDTFVAEEKKRGDDSIFPDEPIFDGRKIVYSRIKLRFEDRITKEVRVKVPEKKFLQKFNVTLTTPRGSHIINLSILNNTANLRSAETELQALDIIMTYGAKKLNLFFNSNMFPKKADLYDLNQEKRDKIRFELPNLKEASFGSYQACKMTQSGTQVNVDRVAMVFHKGGKLLDLITKFINEKRNKHSGFNQRGGGNQRGGFNQRGGGNQRGGFNQRGGGNQRGGFNQRGGGNQRGGFNQRGDFNQQSIRIDASFRFESHEIRILNSELKGLAFVADHLSYKPKNLIYSLSEKPIGKTIFNDEANNRQVSVKDYFEQRYKDTYLANLPGGSLMGNLPCVQVGKLNPKYYPIEVVEILEDQFCMKKLDPDQQKLMTRTCGAQTPVDRFNENQMQIETLIRSSAKCETDFLSTFGIKISTRFVTVNARYLPPPKICGSQDQVKTVTNGEWRDALFSKAAELPKDFQWMVVNFNKEFKDKIPHRPDQHEVESLIDGIISSASRSGLRIGKPVQTVIDESYAGKLDLQNCIESYLKKCPNLSLIVFIIPYNDELYSNIKYLTEVEFGIVTQCVNQQMKRKFGDQSYTNNLVLKLNAKLGGSNCHLKKESRIGHLGKKTMIMGLDVTHPAKHDRMGNSVAAAVATYDRNLINYYSRTVVQPQPRKEIVELERLTVEFLDNFFNKNKFYPAYVLVYRDGVSEGQFNDVIQDEINMMKKAFLFVAKEKGAKRAPVLTYIIAQKRNHVRFLPCDEKDRDFRSQNAKPGLVVDTGIVSNYFSDFYLCAHRGALGTTRPTRYIVLYDESGFTSDEIQRTTYYLSHLFPRCMKSVSLVPPVIYSHLAAKRGRSYLHVLDNKRGMIFGEKELTPAEVKDLNKKIEVKAELLNTLYFV